MYSVGYEMPGVSDVVYLQDVNSIVGALNAQSQNIGCGAL